MAENFKTIDSHLFTYIRDEIKKRYQINDTDFWQNNAYKQHSVVEDRVFTITFPDKMVVKYHQGRATMILGKNLEVQAVEDVLIEQVGDKEFQYKQVIGQQDVGYSRAEADVLDAILYLIRYYEKICAPQKNNTIQHDNEEENGEVTLETETTLFDLFNKNLHIPSYQRIYCWEEEQVKTLLHDIENITTTKYFLGNIILHKRYDKNEKKNLWDIVDGQQRLVTLAILNYFVKDETESDFSLLKCKFLSIEAQQHVYDNAQTIQKYLEDETRKIRIKDNLKKLSFGVLTIDQEHLDLAFTFFTNTNSRGKLLTDYDLLKPHHLRYIPSDYPLQQQLLATQWDKMINESKKEADDFSKRRDAPYIHVIELMLFRLRKWSRKKYGNESDRFVYAEFKTSPFIEEIPPFGENFDYYEPIQGGQHFFEYVEYFIQKYKEFTSTHENSNNENVNIPNVYDLLCDHFTGYSDKWYRYVMEALIFCYYLKFGNSFISEATLSIVRYIAQIRFEKARAYEPTIVNYARESEIVMMVEQATSPTFFLAEIESKINTLPGEEVDGIRKTFLNNCKKLSEALSKRSISVSYQKYSQKYERITSK